MTALTPREVFDRAHQAVLAYDMDGQADLFALDGVWEYPFAPPGLPRRLEGREAIREWSVAAVEVPKQAGRKPLRYESLVVHETSDPEVIVVEFDLAVATATGETQRLPYVQVIRVRNGEIVSLRDYFSAQTVAALSE